MYCRLDEMESGPLVQLIVIYQAWRAAVWLVQCNQWPPVVSLCRLVVENTGVFVQQPAL
jgi:hypothetical protein